jgi:hypothetical protein
MRRKSTIKDENSTPSVTSKTYHVGTEFIKINWEMCKETVVLSMSGGGERKYN